MRAIIIPLFIIAVIVGLYYARDAWDSVKSSVPFIGDKELNLPGGSKEKFIPPASPNSPLENLR